jgi:hypothetical protein
MYCLYVSCSSVIYCCVLYCVVVFLYCVCTLFVYNVFYLSVVLLYYCHRAEAQLQFNIYIYSLPRAQFMNRYIYLCFNT